MWGKISLGSLYAVFKAKVKVCIRCVGRSVSLRRTRPARDKHLSVLTDKNVLGKEASVTELIVLRL